MTCLESRLLVAHYYPYCPQPDLTLGIGSHMDPGVLTVVLQDQVGGLQVKHGEEWVEVKPIHGAIVVNIGDLLQMMSNDEYKSVEHRVLANPFREPRISIGVFFNPSKRGDADYFGPVPELLTNGKVAHYRDFTMAEFMGRLFTRELGSLVFPEIQMPVGISVIFLMMSNDEYKSVEHRVLATPSPEPRISITVFFNPRKRGGTDYPFQGVSEGFT
ncbi:2-oxoglutarate-dependent dioxygenase [Cinnamomum micranthum f. kanehirae]|uniref:2-oxoglutarate-dependent dioxygenase n=1 Tax=Cinnamomum micranthum f. kanehirae TaxID=337451 RepID=A0A443N9B0_9MAGN|nr:2-oxoglutarate-dependent dioxygenase [Cinnamomum micranthum f. kanehirae]